MQHNSNSYSIGFLAALFLCHRSLDEHSSKRYLELVQDVDGYDGDEVIINYIYKTHNLVMTN